MEKDFDELTIADDIAKQCTSMYILGLRVCNANLLLHRTTAVHGGIDTSSIFSSGTDAARIKQKRCFGTGVSVLAAVRFGIFLLLIGLFAKCSRMPLFREPFEIYDAVDAPYISKGLKNYLRFTPLYDTMDCRMRLKISIF